MFDNTKELLQELSLLERECAELSKENATLKEKLNALEKESQHAQRVKRVGHWIMLHKTHNVDEDNDYDWRCSECNHVDCHNINVEVPYCWHCGALMDEEVEE